MTQPQPHRATALGRATRMLAACAALLVLSLHMSPAQADTAAEAPAPITAVEAPSPGPSQGVSQPSNFPPDYATSSAKRVPCRCAIWRCRCAARVGISLGVAGTQRGLAWACQEVGCVSNLHLERGWDLWDLWDIPSGGHGVSGGVLQTGVGTAAAKSQPDAYL